MNATETSLDVLYRDALMLVIDKPAGVAVHAGPKGGPSLEDRFDELREDVVEEGHTHGHGGARTGRMARLAACCCCYVSCANQ